MCGIAGFVGEGNEKNLRLMIESIKYRGPDDQGMWHKDKIGLAHARLSVMDLSKRGHQPMWNEAKNIAVIFNGEIYNFLELKKEFNLGGKYNFHSETDTEIILHLYEELGEACFEKLNGMFAIALYDSREEKLILARDRVGEKPLYWGIFSSTLVFGSEPKALLSHPLVKKEIDPNSLEEYLAFDYIPTPHTIFKNILKINPATYIVYKKGIISEKRFWNPNLNTRKISFKEAVSGLERRLEKSVTERLVSDVPVGIFLSGGIDSSTIAYYAQRNSQQKIKTFSIGFEEKSFDESTFAKEMAKFIGSDHYNLQVSSKEALGVIPKISSVLDEPMADASIIPTLLLSKFTKEKVTVALGGDGGDELFAGYPTFQAERAVALYRKLPSFFEKTLTSVIDNLSNKEKNFNLSFELNKFKDGLIYDGMERHFAWLGSFAPAEINKLLRNKIRNAKNKNVYTTAKKWYPEGGNIDELNKLLWGYLHTYLMDEVLVKIDRASMRYALEVRAPFLDKEVLEWVLQLPANFKLKGITPKYILKKLMEDKLPKSIVYRKKKGFGIPLSRWLKNELKEYCEETLSEKNVKSGELFNYPYIEKLKKDHFEGKADNRKKLWNLLVFENWRQSMGV